MQKQSNFVDNHISWKAKALERLAWLRADALEDGDPAELYSQKTADNFIRMIDNEIQEPFISMTPKGEIIIEWVKGEKHQTTRISIICRDKSLLYSVIVFGDTEDGGLLTFTNPTRRTSNITMIVALLLQQFKIKTPKVSYA